MSVNKQKGQVTNCYLFNCFLLVSIPKQEFEESAFATCSLSTERYKTIEKKYAKNASHHFTIKREL